jgi:hypothetical protein
LLQTFARLISEHVQLWPATLCEQLPGRFDPYAPRVLKPAVQQLMQHLLSVVAMVAIGIWGIPMVANLGRTC